MAVVKFVPAAWVGYDATADRYYVTYVHPSGLRFTDTFVTEAHALRAVSKVHGSNGFKILHPGTMSHAEEMRDAS